MLTVTVERLEDAVVLRCEGRIVRGEETAILCLVAQQRGRDVILDLAKVEAIDAAGIGALVLLQAAGIYLKLANPTAQVQETLKLTKLDTIFEIGEFPSLLGAGRDAEKAVIPAGPNDGSEQVFATAS